MLTDEAQVGRSVAEKLDKRTPHEVTDTTGTRQDDEEQREEWIADADGDCEH